MKKIIESHTGKIGKTESEEKSDKKTESNAATRPNQNIIERSQSAYGYKKTATITGLKLYTVRDYKRRFVQGDYTWLGTQNDQDTTGSLF